MASELPPEDDRRTSPWASRRWQASALFLAVVVVAGGVVLMTTGSPDDGKTAAPTSSAGGPPASGQGPGCPGLTASQDIPRTAPAADWDLVSTVAVPTSKDSGPAVVEGDIARCYAHSPTGALIAAAQIGTRYAFADDWKKVVEEQTYGDGKELLLETRGAYEETAEPVAPVPGELGQFAGYQFVTYTPETAVLQMVSRFDQGVMQVSTVTLRWADGDWQYEIPSVTPPQKTVTSLEGYVVWGGL
ncbi:MULTISPECIES: hypothetical protein [unclassified Streptomyces]|uniref:hypothetical protein n=1 Tax=unclassified Streptomyces TaxID=2593676 RepID=UPI0038163DE8